jgi:hypothetical protein
MGSGLVISGIGEIVCAPCCGYVVEDRTDGIADGLDGSIYSPAKPTLEF